MNEGGSFNYGRNPGWKIPSNPFENLPEDSIGRYFMYIHYICVIYCWMYNWIFIHIYMMNIGQYKCTDRSCDWAKYENTSSTGYLHDWGIYLGVDGDCLNCSKLCSEDLNCGAFECQSTYCSWWKKGVCDKITDATLTATEYRT